MNVKLTSGIRLCGLLVLCLSLNSNAADTDEQVVVAEPPVVVGAATVAILKLQSDGLAAGQIQPISGDVATRSYKRYLDSFTRPIADSKDTTGSDAKPAASDIR